MVMQVWVTLLSEPAYAPSQISDFIVQLERYSTHYNKAHQKIILNRDTEACSSHVLMGNNYHYGSNYQNTGPAEKIT